ncbi:MAG: phosphate acyltransferase PlsX [Oribacterium sp.]|nr:phosphate acyltransferase PlsX [Oribacterium sp.]MDY6317561.1 phosphate acyltransferase PlsX [Oribacterium sp.]
MQRIAIDCMGGDNAPVAIVKGAVQSLDLTKDTKLFLFGPVEKITSLLKEYNCSSDRVEVIDAPDVISLHEAPVMAIRRKKDSSIVKAMHFVKDGQADAFISAGSSGAILAGGQLIIGRLPLVPRPPFGALIPTKKGVCLLLDSGANVDAKPEWLVQYAEMGSVYMKEVVGVKNPKIGLVNVGAEEEKGNQLVKDTMPLLKAKTDINFTGSCEARDISFGTCDVVVCDAFVGNCILKMYEGVGKMLLSEITSVLKSSPVTMLGALLIKGKLKTTLKKFDAKQYGGAPILGLKSLVVKVHGNTDGREITHAIQQASDFIKADAVGKIAAAMEQKTPEQEV